MDPLTYTMIMDKYGIYAIKFKSNRMSAGKGANPCRYI